ncbi:expressed unknown protein [Seminavis robusta]|uniref:Uncharacterized protein n=1 Tax=Seminavis robusta TaxID=568900 RepID=A0A9N8H9B8_9STRA|nr:expressed unknown protein [Seminavis robusta]|eukprot:Sro200_g084720.1 n/a (138) ;mRNA; f:43647-44060
MDATLAQDDSRKDATKDLPKYYNGYQKEFKEWCTLGPNVSYRGQMTKPDKKEYPKYCSKSLAYEFMRDHFILRPQKHGKQGYVKKKAHSKSALDNIQKALKALYLRQKSEYSCAEEFVSFYGDKQPGEGGDINALII